MNLRHMDRQPACRVQAPAASFALEVFCFLVVDQNLEIIEIALAIITPRSGELLLNVGMASLFLTHCSGMLWVALGCR